MIDFSLVNVETFIDPLGSDVHHFRVYHSLEDGSEIRGFGSGNSSENALRKAISEFFERSIHLLEGKKNSIHSSNGFAAHLTQGLAKNAAVAELIERDVVMGCWLTKRSPLWLPLESLQPTDSMQLAVKKFSGAGLECLIGLQAKVGDIFVVVSVLRPTVRPGGFGFVYASSASTDFLSAVEGVILNQRRNYTYVSTNPEKCNLEMQECDVREPGDHRDFYLNPKHLAEVGWLFNSSTPFIEPTTPAIEIKDWQSHIAMPWPLFIVSAQSENIQPYFAGPSVGDRINHKRVGQYAVGPLTTMNTSIHPLP